MNIICGNPQTISREIFIHTSTIAVKIPATRKQFAGILRKHALHYLRLRLLSSKYGPDPAPILIVA